jgi:hypothetical protein
MSNPSAKIESSIRQKLRLCSLAAKGVWYMMREQIEENTRSGGRAGHLLQGSLPLSLSQFAHSCGCQSQEVHAPFQELVRASLIAEEFSGGAFYVPELAAIAAERAKVARRVSKVRGVTNATCNAHVTPERARAPSPASSLPLQPPLNSTPSLSNPPDSSAGSARSPQAGENPESTGAKKPRRRRKERVLTDEQQRIRMEFSDWWMSAAWPRFHGGITYGFESVDGAAVMRLLRHPQVRWDLEKARKVAEFYLSLPELYGLQGHPLLMLSQRVNYYFGKMAQHAKRGDSHVIGVKGAGDFSNVPSKRSLPSGAGSSGVPGGDAKSDRGRAVG